MSLQPVGTLAKATDLNYVTWAFAFITCVLSYYLSSKLYSVFLGPLSTIPGPRLAAATYWYEMFYDVYKPGLYWQKVGEMHRHYGSIVRVNPNEIHIDDPDFYNEIYNNKGKWNKDNRAARQFWAMGSIASTANHDIHKGRRSVLDSYFARGKIDSLQPTVIWHLEKMCSRINRHKQQGKPVPLNLAFACMAADIVTSYLMPQSYYLLDTPDFSPSYYGMMRASSQFSQFAKNIWWAYPVLEAVPRWFGRLFSKVGIELIEDQDFVLDQITKFHDSPEKYTLPQFRYMAGTTSEKTDLLDSPPDLPNGFLIEHILNQPLPGPPSEKSFKRLAQEFQVLIGAGSDQVGLVLSAIIYYALVDETILAKCKAELQAAGVDSGQLPNYRELERLPYLAAMINEGLRITIPLASRLTRVAPDRDIEYDGNIIPAGTTISMSMMDLHHNEKLFPNPQKFDPERWLGDDAAQNKRWLVPFSRGSRNCVGMNLAYAELPLIAAAMFTRFDMELFETSIKDVEFQHDFFAPQARMGTKGVQVMIK